MDTSCGELVFTPHGSVEWHRPNAPVRRRGSNQVWSLIRTLLIAQKTAWQDGFIIFPDWRENRLKTKTYAEAFRTIISKTKGEVVRFTGYKNWHVNAKDDHWRLNTLSKRALNPNVCKAVTLYQDAALKLVRADPEGWPKLTLAWRTWPEPALLANTLIRVPHDDATTVLLAQETPDLRSGFQKYKDELIEAVIAVSLLSNASDYHASVILTRSCGPHIKNWLRRIATVSQLIDAIDERFLNYPSASAVDEDMFLSLVAQYGRMRDDRPPPELHKAIEPSPHDTLVPILSSGLVQKTRNRLAEAFANHVRFAHTPELFDKVVDLGIETFIRHEALTFDSGRSLTARLYRFLSVELASAASLQVLCPQDPIVDVPTNIMADRVASALSSFEAPDRLAVILARLCKSLQCEQAPAPGDFPSKSAVGPGGDEQPTATPSSSFLLEPWTNDPRQDPVLRPLLGQHRFFGGRRREFDRLMKLLLDTGGRYTLVTGPSGVGKTALLVHLLGQLRRHGFEVVCHFINRLVHQASERFCLANLVNQFRFLHTTAPGPSTDEWDMQRQIHESLRRGLPDDRTLVVIIDGLDESLPDWCFNQSVLPPELPSRTHVILAARSGVVADWPTSLGLQIDEKAVVRLGSLSFEDTFSIVSALPFMPQTAAARQSVARRLLELSEGDAFYLAEILDGLERGNGDLSALREYPIGGIRYLRQWWRAANAVAIAHGAQAFADLMGTLACASGPVSRDVLIALSTQDELRGSTFDSLMNHARRYVVGDSQGGYQLSHQRIIEFVREEMRDEIAAYQHRFADLALQWKDPRLPESVRTYIFRHAARHLADAGREQDLTKVIGSDWIASKCQRFGYAACAAGDIDLLCQTLAAQPPSDDLIASLVRCGWWRDRVRGTQRRRLLGVEQSLRVMLGEEERAWAEIEACGTADDQLFVLCELVMKVAHDGRKNDAQYASWIRTIAGSCSPHTLEFAAARIWSANFDLAVWLAQSIPMPPMFEDRHRRENPSRERCLLALFRAISQADYARAITASEQLPTEWERAIAHLALAEFLIRRDPTAAMIQINRILQPLAENQYRRALSQMLAIHLWDQASGAPPAILAAALHVVNSIGPVCGVPGKPFDILDDQISAQPEAWRQASKEVPAGLAHDFVCVRLLQLGHLPELDSGALKDDYCREVARGVHLVRQMEVDRVGAAATAAQNPPLLAVASVFAGIARFDHKTGTRNPNSALLTALHLIEGQPPDVYYYLLLELLEVAVTIPGPAHGVLLDRAVAGLSKISRFFQAPAQYALGRAIVRGLAAAARNPARSLWHLLMGLESEDLRRMVGVAVITQLPTEVCLMLARGARDANLGQPQASSRNSCPKRPSHDTLVRLLSALAERIADCEKQMSQELLKLAVEISANLESLERRRAVQQGILRSAILIRPSWAFQVLPADAISWEAVVESADDVLRDVVRSPSAWREYALRTSIGLAYLSSEPERNRKDLKSAHFAHMAALSAMPSRLSEVDAGAARTAQTGWLMDWIEFSRAFLRQNENDTKAMFQFSRITRWLTLVAPSVYLQILHEPLLGCWSTLDLHEDDMFPAFFQSADDPEATLATLHRLQQMGYSSPPDTPFRHGLVHVRLAALAAYLDPSYCIEILRSQPALRRGFSSDLVHFRPVVHWGVAQFDELVRLLGGRSEDAHRTELAEVLAWLGTAQPGVGDVARALLADAIAVDAPASICQVACPLLQILPSTAADAIAQAFARALLEGDTKAQMEIITSVADVLQSTAGDECSAGSFSAIGSDAVDSELHQWCEREWTPARIVGLVAGLPPGSTYERERLLDAITKRAALGEEELRAWIGQVTKRLATDGQAHRVLGSLALRSIREGKTRHSATIERLPRMTDRIDCLLALASLDSVAEAEAAVEDLAGRIEGISDFSVRWHGLRALGDYFSAFDLERAFSFWHQELALLAADRNHEIDFAFSTNHFRSKCVRYPGKLAESLAEAVESTVRNYTFSHSVNALTVSTRVYSLMASGCCYWRVSPEHCEHLLREALGEYERENSEASVASAVLAMMCRDLKECVGLSEVERFVEAVLKACSEEGRSVVGDGLVRMYALPRNGPQPFKRFGSLGHALQEVEQTVLRRVVFYAHRDKAARGFLMLAISSAPHDRNRVADYIRQAVQCMEGGLNDDEGLFRDVWTTYAALLGITEWPHAFEKLFQRKLRDDRLLPGLVTAALEAVTDGRGLLRRIWETVAPPAQN